MGFCLVIPSIVVVLSRATILVIAPLPYQIVRIAIRGISSGISRTGLAVAALTVAVSVTVGVGIMVGSFRHTVAVWLDQALVGDIYISPTGLVSDDALRRVKQQLTGVDGIKHVVGSRVLNAESEFGPLRLMARTLTDVDTGMPMKEAVPGAEQLFLEGQGVLVSEPLAYHRQRGPGDTISLHTSEGPRQFPIVGVYFDYTSSQGMVVMQHELYRHWWSDDSLTGLTVVGKQGVTADKLLSETRRAIGLDLEHFTVISNGEIRQVALSVFDRTFVITDVMRLLAILVAAVSVLSALIALQLERTREFGILRATGMTPGQIRLMIIVQTLLIGLFAGLLAIPLGLLMAEVLIEVINRRAFGWSMQQTLPVDVLIQAMVLALGSAFLAGLYPAHKAATISPSMALREE
jgi:putative ABC transport system permease protein